MKDTPERLSRYEILERAVDGLVNYHYAVKELDGQPEPDSQSRLDAAEHEKNYWVSMLDDDEQAQAMQIASDRIGIKEEMEE